MRFRFISRELTNFSFHSQCINFLLVFLPFVITQEVLRVVKFSTKKFSSEEVSVVRKSKVTLNIVNINSLILTIHIFICAL